MSVPVLVVDEAIETGLVGGACELGVDTGDGVAGGDEEAGEILGEVAALRFIGEQIAELAERLLDHLGEIDDAGHGLNLNGKKIPQSVQKSLLTARVLPFAKGQIAGAFKRFLPSAL